MTPQALPDDITIDQASPVFWVACPEVICLSDGGRRGERRGEKPRLPEVPAEVPRKPAALGAAKHARFERVARGERDASAIVRDAALSDEGSELSAWRR